MRSREPRAGGSRLQEFLDHSPDQVTAAWDAVIEELGQPEQSGSAPAAREVFENTEW